MAQDRGLIHSVALLCKKLTVRFITQGNKAKCLVACDGLTGIPIEISPTNLVFELIIQKKFYSQTRLVGLIKCIQKNFKLAAIHA